MGIRKITMAISVVLGIGGPTSLYATDLAIIQTSNNQTLPSLVAYNPSGDSSDDPSGPVKMAHFRDPQLICNLAKLYETGKGVERDDEKAFELYQYAAVNGIADAQYAIGLMYSEERGAANVADTQQMAMFWLDKAASQGHKGAEFTYQYLLNNTHYSGC